MQRLAGDQHLIERFGAVYPLLLAAHRRAAPAARAHRPGRGRRERRLVCQGADVECAEVDLFVAEGVFKRVRPSQRRQRATGERPIRRAHPRWARVLPVQEAWVNVGSASRFVAGGERARPAAGALPAVVHQRHAYHVGGGRRRRRVRAAARIARGGPSLHRNEWVGQSCPPPAKLARSSLWVPSATASARVSDFMISTFLVVYDYVLGSGQNLYFSFAAPRPRAVRLQLSARWTWRDHTRILYIYKLQHRTSGSIDSSRVTTSR